MLEAPIPRNEAQRQQALDRLCVVDTPPEERYERIVRLAQRLLNTPIAIVSLIDHQRQWFKAINGLDVKETPRSISFCGHAIHNEHIFVVEDAARDPRFADNPLVVGAPHIRYYAGRPLRAADGAIVGTLCVIDVTPRQPSNDELTLLDDLAVLTERELNAAQTSAQAEALRSERARLRAIIDSALDGLISVDNRGHIVEFNPAAERIFGYARAEVIGRDMADLIVPEAMRAAHTRGVSGYLAGKESKIIGRRLVINAMRKGGSEFPAELSVSATPDGLLNGFTGHFRDISETLQIRSSMELMAAQLNTIFNANPDGLLAFSGDGTLQLINPAFVQMTGLSRHDLLEISRDLFDAKFSELCVEAPVGLASLAGDDDQLITLHRPRPRTLKRVVRRMATDNESPLAWIVYFRDITEEMAVDRMKSEFLSTAAHELRTPLASIHGFTELLLEGQYDADTQHELLQTVHDQSRRLATLVNELLDLARIEARAGKDFNIRPQRVQPVIDRVVKAFVSPNDPRTVTVIPPSAPLNAAMDEDKIVQALNNVISNAYKYSPDGGPVTLSVIRAPLDGRPMVGISVRDEGLGMTEEQVSRAFERFYRADSNGAIPGTGLGLCLVREIVLIHQGTVDIESKLNRGTTVTLWLPETTETDAG